MRLKSLPVFVVAASTFLSLPVVHAQTAAPVVAFSTYKEAVDAASKSNAENKNVEAIALWEAAAELAGNVREKQDAFVNLSGTYRRLLKFADSAKQMQKAVDLSINPDEKSYYLRNVGDIFLQEGDTYNSESYTLASQQKEDESKKKMELARTSWAASVKAYETAAGIPGSTDRGSALRGVGNLRRRLKEYDKAREAYEQMAAFNIEISKFSNTYDCANQVFQVYWEENKTAEARAALEKAIAMPGMPANYLSELLSYVRETYRREANWPASREASQKVIALVGASPDSVSNAWAGVAESYRQEKDNEKYQGALRDALKSEVLTPAHKAYFLTILADTLRVDKNLAGARETITKGLEIQGLPNRTVASLRFGLANIAVDEKNFSAAHAEYEKVAGDLRMHEHDRMDAMRNNGDIFVQEQNWSAGREWYNKLKEFAAAAANPGNVWDAQRRIVSSYVGEKKFEPAQTTWKQMITMDGIGGDSKAECVWGLVNAYPDDPESTNSAIALADMVLTFPDLSATWVGHIQRLRSDRLMKLGKFKEAADALESLAGSQKADANTRIDALFRLLNLYQTQKNTTEAINLCNRIMKSADASQDHKDNATRTLQALSATPAQ